MQKHVNIVDLVKSSPTNIFLQILASIQRRTSPIKFAHLAEKSENDSISNLSTKDDAAPRFRGGQGGVAVSILRFDVSAGEEQAVRGVELAPARRCEQRGIPGRVPGVNGQPPRK